jgi:DNA-binding NtrC family response regulator
MATPPVSGLINSYLRSGLPLAQGPRFHTKGGIMNHNTGLDSNEAKIACRSDATVLITGPTGSGKTRLAQAIHDAGARSAKAFVTVNLASLHEGTLESELFGHEKGAFTGADQRRIGRIERAQGGTLFLDEIGELQPRLQARLLEFLQSRVLTPVGSSRSVRLDVRIIAATHRKLAKEVEQGRFREDLFHRLRVVTLELPSLIDRPEQFDLILHSCLEEVCAATGRSISKLSEGAAERLEQYSWPGNIRELRNVLEYAVLAAEGAEIVAHDLPGWFGKRGDGAPQAADPGAGLLGVLEFPLTLDFNATLARFEREYLTLALRRGRGKINKTARAIGVNKTTLMRRMRIYGLYAESRSPVFEKL